MTYGDKLIQQGMQQGRQEERYAVAKNMLHENAPMDKVARWTKLFQQELASLV